MILLFRALMNYQVADSVFLGIRLEKSIVYGLAEALAVLPQDGSQARFMTIVYGAFSNPSGLLQAGLYLPSLILMLAISFLTWFQQKISGAGNNPQMASMNVIMPVMMGFICLSLPGGVLVYWGTTSLIGIIQQWFIMRRTKEIMAVKPTLYKNKPAPGRPAEVIQQEEDDEDEYEDDDDEEYEDDEDEYEDEEEDDDDKGEVK
jgi:YidC/Oxa1 family membrane protein insertase